MFERAFTDATGQGVACGKHHRREGTRNKKKRRDKMHDADDEGIDHDDGDGDGGRRERNKKMKIKHKNPIPHLDKIEGHDLNPIDRELEPWY